MRVTQAAADRLLGTDPQTKYRAKRTKLDGITFDSTREAEHYCELKLEQRAGSISDLELQPEFVITVNGKRIGVYRADFQYVRDGVTVIEDVKGVRTPVYRLKKKLVEALHSVTIKEVK